MARASQRKGIVEGALIVLASCAVLGVLVIGADFLVPIVVAFLIVSLISSTVDRLVNAGLSSTLAMLVALSIGLGAIIGFFLIIYYQAQEVSEAWPKYAARLTALSNELSAQLGSEIFAKLVQSLSEIDFSGIASRVADSVGGTLGAIALVAMYSAFLLAERGLLPEKFGYLVPNKAKADKYRALYEQVSRGVRQYLWIKTLMSVTTGGLCYIILRYFAVDFAEFWGVLIFLLNYIPSLGSIVGVILPSVFALLQFDTIWPFVQIAVLLTCVQFTIGNIVEPKYMGETLNMSPFVVIVALTFWGTIWGIQGMFLSVPFTASLIIICGNIPSLRWIAILFSEDGRIDPKDKPAKVTGKKEPNDTGGFSFFRRSAADRAEIDELRREINEIKKNRASRDA